MRSLSPFLLAGGLALTQGCILAIDAGDDDRPWWADDEASRWDDDDDDDDDDGLDDTAILDDSDSDVVAPVVDVQISLDVDVMRAGTVTLLLGSLDGDAASTDVQAIAFEAGVDVLDYAPTGTRTFALVVAAHADAEGAYDAWFDFGDLGTATFDDLLRVEASTDTDDAPYCTK